ncbi:T9SS type A sorting domain-containing protein [Limibacter armeniacum]|uniref:T9SS type A sorting domain-containing protein n=1 Tax=Limibacter armeniacum TaxID=466084 RepID=UPI002FE687F7
MYKIILCLAVCILTLLIPSLQIQAQTNNPDDVSCDTIFGITGTGTLEWIHPASNTSGLYENNISGVNALAINSDLGLAYYANNQMVYWYDLKTKEEGLLGTFNVEGDLQSGGAAFHEGSLYIGTEVESMAKDIYRIQLNPDGKSAKNGPAVENLTNGNGPTYDYGDIVVDGPQDDLVIYGSTYDGIESQNTIWMYQVASDTYTELTRLKTDYVFQLAKDGNGKYWAYNFSTGELHNVTFNPFTIINTVTIKAFTYFDLGGSYCSLSPCNLTVDKVIINTTDETENNQDGTATITTTDADSLLYTISDENGIIEPEQLSDSITVENLSAGIYSVKVTDPDDPTCSVTRSFEIGRVSQSLLTVSSICRRAYEGSELYSIEVTNSGSIVGTIRYIDINGNDSQIPVPAENTINLISSGMEVHEVKEDGTTHVLEIDDNAMDNCFSTEIANIQCIDIVWIDEQYKQKWEIKNTNPTPILYRIATENGNYGDWEMVNSDTTEVFYLPFDTEIAFFMFENEMQTEGKCDTCDGLTGFVTPEEFELLNRGDIIYYPNPVMENLTVKVPCITETVEIQLYNAIGQMIAEYTVGGSQFASFDMSTYSSGMYIMRTKINGKMIFKRLIIL